MALFTGHTITPDSALGGIEIEKSLRFEESDTTYLEASPTFNTKKYTFSVWVKPVKKGGGCLLGYNSVGNNRQTFSYSDYEGHWANQLRKGGSTKSQYATSAAFRDMSSWYHVVYVWDTDNGTQADRFIVYVNGVRADMTQYTGTVSGITGYIGDGNTLNIGKSTDNYSKARFYLADYHLIDGQAYDASYFGFTDALTGQWRPKKYTGSYGSGGFHLEFKDTSNLGKDTSGNGNNWTANNFSVSAGYGNDSLEDTPTNNFCVMNGEGDNDNITCTNGGLQLTQADTSVGCRIRGTQGMPPNTGKYYYEMEIQTGSSYNFGMKGVKLLGSHTSGNDDRYAYYGHNGNKTDESSSSSYGASYTAGDTVAILYDSDAGHVYFYKNNTSQGLAFTGVNDKTYLPFVYLDNYGTNPVVHMNFGQRPFKYTPPTGARGLSSKSLATPVAAGVVNPQKHFDTLTWAGNSTDGHTIDGLEFTPDLVWIKNRSESVGHYWVDSMRKSGSDYLYLQPNDTGVEADASPRFTSINRGGFTLPSGGTFTNSSGDNFVGWCWKAGGAAVSNSDGTITSSVSANTEAGFSIVSYTGNETNDATVGHGLGKSPDMVIIKDRVSNSAGNNWYVFHSALASGHYVKLNQTSATTAVSGTSNGGVGSVTSTTFNFVQGTSGNNKNVNENGDNFIAYCWTSIAGYSSMGSYKGVSASGTSGGADGPYVHCGFKPAWILIKQSSGTNNWIVTDIKRDTKNPTTGWLYPDLAYQEETDSGRYLDILSTGFKIRSPGSGFNTDGETYIYVAFAEQPSGTGFGLDANSH